MAARLLTPRTAAWLLLAAAGWLVWAGRVPVHATTTDTTQMPSTLEAWTGQALPVSVRDVELLGTDDVALMEFRHDGQEHPVWLLQVASVGTRASFHPPELCYVGSNFEVIERGPLTVTVHGRQHRLMRLVVRQDGQDREVWYWFTAADRVTPSYYEQQLWLVADLVRRRPTSGRLVRISTPIEDPQAAHERLVAFVNTLTYSSDILEQHGA